MSRLLSLDQAISNFKEVHGDLYDYSLITEYTGSYKKYPIICNRCKNTFWMSYRLHKKDKCGCKNCNKTKYTENFKEYYLPKLLNLYGNLYDFSLVTNNPKARDTIPILCKTHGTFYKELGSFLAEYSYCPSCKKSLYVPKSRLDLESIKAIVQKESNSLLKIVSTEYTSNKQYLEFYCEISKETYLKKWNVYTKANKCSCSLCLKESRKGSLGWTPDAWVKACSERNLTLFLYIIKLQTKSETFYKIGISTNIKKRFRHFSNCGYVITNLMQFTGDTRLIFNLERVLLRNLRQNHYQPSMSFGGDKRECFSNIDGILDHIPFDQVEVITDLLSQKEIAA